MKKFALVFSITGVVAAVCLARALENPNSTQQNGAVQVQMHNVMYHYSDSVSVHLRDLAGTLVPSSAGQLPVFDDRKSFGIQITAAEIAMPPQSLASILNSNVFVGKDAPLKDIDISIDKGHLKVKGKLHKKGDIGFEMEGQLSATADGKIRLHAEKIK